MIIKINYFGTLKIGFEKEKEIKINQGEQLYKKSEVLNDLQKSLSFKIGNAITLPVRALLHVVHKVVPKKY